MQISSDSTILHCNLALPFGLEDGGQWCVCARGAGSELGNQPTVYEKQPCPDPTGEDSRGHAWTTACRQGNILFIILIYLF